MYANLMIVVIPLFGVVSGNSFARFTGAMLCPEFSKQYCACNYTEKAKIVPLRMCLEGDECKVCPLDVQDHLDCSVCPGNTCPVCSENEFGLRDLNKKDLKEMFERSDRKSRDAWEPLPHDSWCVFNQNMMNGQVECTFTSYSKECVLSCYEPFTVNGQRELSFACKRKDNVWTPAIQPCIDTSGTFDGVPHGHEEPQQHSAPHVTESKPTSESDGNNHDSHVGDNLGAGAEEADEAKEEDDYGYESDDDGDDQQVPQKSGTGDLAAPSHTSGDSLPQDAGGSDDHIAEDVMKDFYDLLNSE